MTLLTAALSRLPEFQQLLAALEGGQCPVALAGAAGVKRMWMAHFSPDYDDGFLREQEGLARAACPACAFAREGMVTEL